MADDDPDDRMFMKEAWDESRVANELKFVTDGEELLDYLHQRGDYDDPEEAPRPGLILLDLNMPRVDGREALEKIKNHEELQSIPIVVLTSSKAEEDILRSYDMGVNSYIVKPVTFEKLVDVIQTLGLYWLEIVELPRQD
jgi:CheY-like chemotaxis protein